MRKGVPGRFPRLRRPRVHSAGGRSLSGAFLSNLRRCLGDDLIQRPVAVPFPASPIAVAPPHSALPVVRRRLGSCCLPDANACDYVKDVTV
jgi:hypothetical protein